MKISNVGKIVIVAIAAVVIIVLTVIFTGGGGTNNNPIVGESGTVGTVTSTTVNTTGTSTNAAPTTIKAPTRTPGAPTKTTAKPAVFYVHIITPVANDIWTIGAQNVISWDHTGGSTGSISLINAATGQFVGVILNEVGPNQTSYTWNTRDIFLDRTNPLKKDVVPGTYEIHIVYDGNNITPITSPAFTITN